MCTDHSHSNRRCRCCDPAVRRARYRARVLSQRGVTDAASLPEDYLAARAAVRASMASRFPEAAYDSAPSVRAARARCKDLSRDDAEHLAGDHNTRVRVALAGNATASAEALDMLAADPDRSVREALAGNAAADPDTLDALAVHLDRRRDLGTVRALCANPRTPATALRHLQSEGTAAWRRLAGEALNQRR